MTDMTPAILAAQRADALLAQIKLERRLDFLELTTQLLRKGLSVHMEAVSESLESLMAEVKELQARLRVVEVARGGEADSAHEETGRVVVER